MDDTALEPHGVQVPLIQLYGGFESGQQVLKCNASYQEKIRTTRPKHQTMREWSRCCELLGLGDPFGYGDLESESLDPPA